VAMEGYNGWARPLDTLVRAHGYRLFNINNPWIQPRSATPENGWR